MMLRRLVSVLCGVMVLGTIAAPMAGADPAKPSNYRSTVEAITPATAALQAKVVGGDGFLEIEVAPGHTLKAKGYQGEPWLRVLANGSVQENQSAPTTFLNVSRYGTAIPAGVTPEGAAQNPVWKTVAHSGRFIWHDHRIHYMTPSLPPRLVPGTRRVAIGDGPGGRWTVPVVLDGTPTIITGSLALFDPPSPAISWAIAAVVAVAIIGLALLRRQWALPLASLAIVTTGGLAVWSGYAELSVVPTEAGGNPISVALPIFAVVAALLAVALRSKASKVIAVLAGAAALGAWALLRVPSFSKAFPLGDLAPGLSRAIAAAALGAAVGAVGSGIASGGLALRLDLLEDDDPAPEADATAAVVAGEDAEAGAEAGIGDKGGLSE